MILHFERVGDEMYIWVGAMHVWATSEGGEEYQKLLPPTMKIAKGDADAFVMAWLRGHVGPVGPMGMPGKSG